MRNILIFALLFITTVVSAAPNYGGTLVFGRSGDSVSLDPSHATDGESFYGTKQVYDTLVQFKNGTTTMVPALATSWSVSDDGLTYIFNLRKNVFFAPTKYFKKKSEFTADDVIFSLKRQFDKSHPYNSIGGTFKYWGAMNMTKIVKDIVKVDKYTVKITLNKREAPFLSNMAMDFASILSNDYANELLKKGQGAKLSRYPVGTGPFVFQKWIKDDRIILENPSFTAFGSELKPVARNFEEMKELLKRTRRSFCLDFANASVTAYGLGIDYIKFIKKLLSLKPKVFHINDSRIKSRENLHLHLGEGDLDLGEFKKMMHRNSFATITTTTDFNKQLRDIKFMKGILPKSKKPELVELEKFGKPEKPKKSIFSRIKAKIKKLFGQKQ